jgi:hypothetical protein
MIGREVTKTIDGMRTENHQFVKWWRKENDFLDYDLLDRFVNNRDTGEEIGGLELLTMDDMWNEVKRVVGKRVNLVHEPKGDSIEWTHKVKDTVRTDHCAYTPPALIAIYDAETRGNPVGM